MTLGELIAFLEWQDQSLVLPIGFANPHSYRGVYAELAFEMVCDISVAQALASAREALGTTYTGYKGGEFKMEEWTEVHLADYGNTGETIGPVMLQLMISYAKANKELR